MVETDEDEEGDSSKRQRKEWREEGERRSGERAFSQGVTPAVSVADEICHS